MINKTQRLLQFRVWDNDTKKNVLQSRVGCG